MPDGPVAASLPGMEIGAGEPLLRSDLFARGVTADEVDRARRAGRLAMLRRGAYLAAGDERLGDRAARYALTVRAAARQLARDDGVLSHQSAAALHGLPLWSVPTGRTHLIRPGVAGGRRSASLHLHRARLEPDEVVLLGGVRVTSPARTVVDLARSLPFEQAVVITDAALHTHLVDPDALREALIRADGRRGLPAARRVVAFADGAADGPGESCSRVRFDRAGLPRPVLQHPIRDPDGRFVAQVDFWWPEFGVVGEFDGEIKYGRLMKPGQNPCEVVYAEKRREDAVRAQGPTVVRWDWRDLETFDEVIIRLTRLFTPS